MTPSCLLVDALAVASRQPDHTVLYVFFYLFFKSYHREGRREGRGFVFVTRQVNRRSFFLLARVVEMLFVVGERCDGCSVFCSLALLCGLLSARSAAGVHLLHFFLAVITVTEGTGICRKWRPAVMLRTAVGSGKLSEHCVRKAGEGGGVVVEVLASSFHILMAEKGWERGEGNAVQVSVLQF